MKVIENGARFDEMQEALLKEMARAIRMGLGETGLDPDKAFEATEQITFSVAALIDGSAPVMVEGRKIEPFLTFKAADESLISSGGSSMHEMAFDVALEVCGDIDEAESQKVPADPSLDMGAAQARRAC